MKSVQYSNRVVFINFRLPGASQGDHMKELVKEITVSWAHCDAAGIVFYPNFIFGSIRQLSIYLPIIAYPARNWSKNLISVGCL